MNKKTKALTTEQYKEIIQAMKEGFSGCRPNERIATVLVLEGNLGLRISDILKLRLCDIALVQRLLQHSSAATTQRYIGIEPQRIEQAIENHTNLLSATRITPYSPKVPFVYIPSSYSIPLVFGTVIKETVSDGLFFIQSSSRRVLSRCNREYVTVS